jgi:hypothetical protein
MDVSLTPAILVAAQPRGFDVDQSVGLRFLRQAGTQAETIADALAARRASQPERYSHQVRLLTELTELTE